MDNIFELLVGDKFVNLSQIAEILKEEVTQIARNFVILNDDVVVRFRREDDIVKFDIELQASRIKPFGGRV